MPDQVISTENLSKTYVSGLRRKRVHALQGVDISVERGEIVGILGPNGAGKTTFLKILLGIVSPTGGSAMLMGCPAGSPESRKSLGYLPENHRFPTYLTARQTLDVYGRLSDLPSTQREERIPMLLKQAGLAGWEDSRVGTFSKGMMQRLGLAQALMNDPEIIVLDEPTDGVDPVGRREIRDRLGELRRQGKTILINSHLLSEIELICDRVIILNHGRIVRAGTVDELVTQGLGWRLQLKGVVPDDVSERFTCHTEEDASGPVLVLDTGDVIDLNALIDHLRSSNVSILGIERNRRSLEAGFIEIIESGEAQA